MATAVRAVPDATVRIVSYTIVIIGTRTARQYNGTNDRTTNNGPVRPAIGGSNVTRGQGEQHGGGAEQMVKFHGGVSY